VFDDAGRCVGRLDVCWPDAGLWVELDGRGVHDRPQALLYDRHRQNDLASRLQWLPLRFTWDDVTRRPRHTTRLTEAAYRRRAEWQGLAAFVTIPTPIRAGYH
jgi:very-short-patch-repair endonuclease